MKVEKKIELGNGHRIEFGKATWNNLSISVRNRYPTKTGGFSPRSSSEIPIEDVKLIVEESIKNGYISDNQLIEIVETCVNTLKNKTAKNKNQLSKDQKIDLIRRASNDVLFLNDINEVTNDFDVIDSENI